MRAGCVCGGPGCIGDVSHCLGNCEEELCRFDVYHWQWYMEADEGIRVGGVDGKKIGEEGELFGEDPELHVCVAQVNLGEEDRNEGRVCVHNLSKQRSKGPPQMDGIRRGTSVHGIIKTTKIAVIYDLQTL